MVKVQQAIIVLLLQCALTNAHQIRHRLRNSHRHTIQSDQSKDFDQEDKDMVFKNFEIASSGDFEMNDEIREQKERYQKKLVQEIGQQKMQSKYEKMVDEFEEEDNRAGLIDEDSEPVSLQSPILSYDQVDQQTIKSVLKASSNYMKEMENRSENFASNLNQETLSEKEYQQNIEEVKPVQEAEPKKKHSKIQKTRKSQIDQGEKQEEKSVEQKPQQKSTQDDDKYQFYQSQPLVDQSKLAQPEQGQISQVQQKQEVKEELNEDQKMQKLLEKTVNDDDNENEIKKICEYVKSEEEMDEQVQQMVKRDVLTQKEQIKEEMKQLKEGEFDRLLMGGSSFQGEQPKEIQIPQEMHMVPAIQFISQKLNIDQNPKKDQLTSLQQRKNEIEQEIKKLQSQ